MDFLFFRKRVLRPSSAVSLFCLLLLVVSFIGKLQSFTTPDHSHQWSKDWRCRGKSGSDAVEVQAKKPDHVLVSGLVFFGRRDRASCMYCYLQRNLVDHGGWLDEILWVVNTDDKDDLAYLDEIVTSNPMRHKTIRITGDKLYSHTFYKAWQNLEWGKYYVKIDDDIVWFDSTTIPQLVMRKLTHPVDLVVSANIVNNPPLGFLHLHTGALHPYLPEVEKPRHIPNTWKPSQHGYWKGPDDFTWQPGMDPPYPGHRWLRVKEDGAMIRTPATSLTFEQWGPSYTSWAIATQMHYSLFENLEAGSLLDYDFGTWYTNGERVRINFICVFADDILATNISDWPRDRSDEDMLALDLPKSLNRPVVVVGGAIASHLQYQDQVGISDTDILSRYQMIANDHGCL